jgi:hypothetical protein
MTEDGQPKGSRREKLPLIVRKEAVQVRLYQTRNANRRSGRTLLQPAVAYHDGRSPVVRRSYDWNLAPDTRKRAKEIASALKSIEEIGDVPPYRTGFDSAFGCFGTSVA